MPEIPEGTVDPVSGVLEPACTEAIVNSSSILSVQWHLRDDLKLTIVTVFFLEECTHTLKITVFFFFFLILPESHLPANN